MASAFTATFNATEVAFTDVFTYDASTGSWSSNLYATTDFDYFPDSIGVDDCIYFANPKLYGAKRDRQIFKDVKVNVGTALVADAITIVWEYWNGSAWTALSNVVDNTNNFTVTGANWITFDVPSDWGYNTVNGQSGRFVRCRVTAVTNPSEGGANTTDTVKCGNNTVNITAGDGDFDDLYQLIMVDNNWSPHCYKHPSGHYFYFGYIHIIFGSGATLTDSHKMVEFHGNHLQIYNWTLGTKDATSDYGRDGCTLFFSDVSGSGVHSLKAYHYKFYGCTFYFNLSSRESNAFYGASDVEVLDSLFFAKSNQASKNFGMPNWGSSSGIVVKRTKVFIYQTSYGWMIQKDGTFEDIFGQNKAGNNYGMVLRSEGWPSYTQTLKGLITSGNIKETATRNGTIYLINSSFNDLVNQYLQVGTQTTWYIQFTFDLKVVDNNNNPIDGATVTIDYQDGLGQAFSGTTDANGDITQQNLTYYKVFMEKNESDITTYYGNPVTVTISKTGYKTRVIKYTMDRKREEIEVLENRREV